SLTVMRPLMTLSSSTRGSFSTLCSASSSKAFSADTPTGAVTSGIFVIVSATVRVGNSLRVTKRRSRLVTMPRRTPLSSTTGSPEIRYLPDLVEFGQRLVRGDRQRVVDHARFGALDVVDLVGLVLGREVAVDDAQAADASHGDGHPRFGDGVHGRGDKRDVDLDLFGQASCSRGF